MCSLNKIEEINNSNSGRGVHNKRVAHKIHFQLLGGGEGCGRQVGKRKISLTARPEPPSSREGHPAKFINSFSNLSKKGQLLTEKYRSWTKIVHRMPCIGHPIFFVLFSEKVAKTAYIVILIQQVDFHLNSNFEVWKYMYASQLEYEKNFQRKSQIDHVFIPIQLSSYQFSVTSHDVRSLLSSEPRIPVVPLLSNWIERISFFYFQFLSMRRWIFSVTDSRETWALGPKFQIDFDLSHSYILICIHMFVKWFYMHSRVSGMTNAGYKFCYAVVNSQNAVHVSCGLECLAQYQRDNQHQTVKSDEYCECFPWNV